MNTMNDNKVESPIVQSTSPQQQEEMIRTPLVNGPNKTVITFEHGSPNTPFLPKYSITVTCQHCNNNVQTRVDHQVGTGTYCASAAMCLICCPLAWIPCVVDGCKDVVHYCPNCGSSIGMNTIL